MNYKSIQALALSLLFSMSTFASTEKNDSTEVANVVLRKWLDGSYLSSQIFLGYQYYNFPNSGANEFVVKRGYINFSKDISPFIVGRITPDITIDQEGDGEGDVELRLKYCYMQFKIPTWSFITEPSIYIGQVFTPWIEFEEKINRYRVEGAHFLNRIKQTPSADFGVTFTTLIGGKLDSDYRKLVNSRYAGKFGSIAIGIYNGGGYHALEKNSNKTFQWRVSIRPLPKSLTGFQLSATGVIGKGNTNLSPQWNMKSIALSYEHEWFNITGQGYSAIGDYAGCLIDETTGNSLLNKGNSAFAEIKLLKKKVSLIGRYDFQNVKSNGNWLHSTRYIAGIAYHLTGRNKIMLDYNQLVHSNNHPLADEQLFEILLELAL
jgi:hypothetical protein